MTLQSDGFDREEVDRENALRVRPEERSPGSAPQVVLLRARSREFKELEIVGFGISWRYFVGRRIARN